MIGSNYRSCVPVSHKMLLLIGVLFMSSGAFAQLTSASVNNISFSKERVTNPLTNATDTLDLMSVEVVLNDIETLGEILVTVYDQQAGFPVQMAKVTKADLENSNLINGSVATVQVLGVPPVTGSYAIEVQVRNNQGANLPLVSAQY